jgi:hypothetical protein
VFFNIEYRWSASTFLVPLWRCRQSLSLAATTLNSIDLSKVTKLKVLKVRLTNLPPGRLTATLETLTAENRDLRQISIYLPFHRIPRGDARSFFGDDIYQKWLGLDRLLVQFWELHSIRTKVVVTESMWGDEEMKGRIGRLFPEMAARGIVDVAEECY